MPLSVHASELNDENVADENKDEKGEDPKEDKGSEPEIDPKLKERAEIKFKATTASPPNPLPVIITNAFTKDSS